MSCTEWFIFPFSRLFPRLLKSLVETRDWKKVSNSRVSSLESRLVRTPLYSQNSCELLTAELYCYWLKDDAILKPRHFKFSLTFLRTIVCQCDGNFDLLHFFLCTNQSRPFENWFFDIIDYKEKCRGLKFWCNGTKIDALNRLKIVSNWFGFLSFQEYGMIPTIFRYNIQNQAILCFASALYQHMHNQQRNDDENKDIEFSFFPILLLLLVL